MAGYTVNTSDKSKKTALIWWAVGLLGVLGIENFYVGKIKKGFIRLGVGILFVLAISEMISMSKDGSFNGTVPITIIFWAIVAVPNLVKLLFGTFRDNVGQPLRK